MTYAEKLQDPKWLAVRKKVLGLQREPGCWLCGSTTQPLDVHHKWYVSGKDPWDYPLWSLVVLCRECHKREHDTWDEDAYNMCNALRQITGGMEGELDVILSKLKEAGGAITRMNSFSAKKTQREMLFKFMYFVSEIRDDCQKAYYTQPDVLEEEDVPTP